MFPAKKRVPKNNIEEIIKEGQKIYSESFLIKKNKNHLSTNRFAVVVSKKVSKEAVQRNLIKRRFLNAIQYIFKNNDKKDEDRKQENNNESSDYVLLVSPKQKDFTYDKILKELEEKFKNQNN